VARTCSSPCSTCFCHWVGGGPDSPEGTDALFTLIEDGCVLTPYTDKGAQLLKDLPAANGQAVSEAEAGRAAARKILAYAPARLARMGEVAEKIAGRFAQTEFWQEHTAGCLACGACTYMCPTCQCFTITDEGDLSRGKRLCSWDSCMNAHFTREASGHNPRAAKAVRMRQRVSHKYSYSPQNAAIYSCTGCGRCVRYCPAALDIREIVLAATAD
jgi:ferredoxin